MLAADFEFSDYYLLLEDRASLRMRAHPSGWRVFYVSVNARGRVMLGWMGFSSRSSGRTGYM